MTTTVRLPGPLYEAGNISKHHGAVFALDDVSMTINAGEIVGLVGDNGAGSRRS
jgi:simple sugar transport system ATP-binding protein